MPAFIKVCPICFEQFYTTRLSQTFDKKKCANKMRSISAKMFQAMLDKANKCTQVLETVPKAVLDFIKKQQDVVLVNGVDISKLPVDLQVKEQLKVSSLSEQDRKTLFMDIAKLRRVNEVNRLEKEFTTPDGRRIGDMTGDLYDPEMVNFDKESNNYKQKDFNEIIGDNSKYISPTDQASGNADGFSEKPMAESQVSKSQKPNGLRRLGGK